MTLLDISVPFSLGVVSSLHCAQMCGPIVLAYSLRLDHRPGLSHVAYNSGRLATYTLLGALAGLAGTLGHLAGIERWVAIACGVAMLVSGLLLLPRKGGLIQIGSPPLLSRLAGALLGGNKFFFGLLMGFLPCGLVYAALIQAMSTESAVTGAVSMLAFGAGTSGALMGIGLFSRTLASRPGKNSALLTSAAVVLAGCFLIWRGVYSPVAGTRCH